MSEVIVLDRMDYYWSSYEGKNIIVKGDVSLKDCDGLDYYNKLGFNILYVGGNFMMQNPRIRKMVGCPIYVEKNFYWNCYGEKKYLLYSFKDAPIYVGGDCVFNTTLAKTLSSCSTEFVGGKFLIDNMKNLNTLKGMPKYINEMAISNCPHIEKIDKYPSVLKKLSLNHLKNLKYIFDLPKETEVGFCYDCDKVESDWKHYSWRDRLPRVERDLRDAMFEKMRVMTRNKAFMKIKNEYGFDIVNFLKENK